MYWYERLPDIALYLELDLETFIVAYSYYRNKLNN